MTDAAEETRQRAQPPPWSWRRFWPWVLVGAGLGCCWGLLFVTWDARPLEPRPAPRAALYEEAHRLYVAGDLEASRDHLLAALGTPAGARSEASRTDAVLANLALVELKLGRAGPAAEHAEESARTFAGAPGDRPRLEALLRRARSARAVADEVRARIGRGVMLAGTLWMGPHGGVASADALRVVDAFRTAHERWSTSAWKLFLMALDLALLACVSSSVLLALGPLREREAPSARVLTRELIDVYRRRELRRQAAAWQLKERST